MTVRLDRRQLLAAAASMPALALAQGKGAAQPQEGIEYTTLKTPQSTESGERIEILEFFQYTCPHCAAFEPDLEVWRKQRMPVDCTYRRLPVAFDPRTQPLAQTYFALEQLKRLDELHVKVFDAIHKARRSLLKPEEIADFMVSSGIDRAQWTSTFNSFSVVSRTKRATQVWAAWKLEGTPSLGVDGRWLTGPSMTGSRASALQVVDFLILQARKARSGVPKK